MEQQETSSVEKSNENDQEAAVKNEPVAEQVVEESDDEPAEDFLDELLNSAGDIAAACATPRNNKDFKPDPSNTNVNDAEEIDPSFFDDILSRKNERQQATRNKVRLKRERVDLEDGEVEEITDGDDECSINVDTKGKSKKSKKAKRKKSKDEKSPQKSTKDNVEKAATSPTSALPENRPRLQVRAEFRSFISPARSPTPEEPVASPGEEQTPIETHIGSACIFPTTPFQLSVRQEEPVDQKPEKELTPAEKLSKALERVSLAKYAFLKNKHQKDKLFYPNDPVFAYTPTVRKLPTSFSHFTQHLYDNRSPLHTVNNVTFEFNSMVTRLNLEEWGLEPLPPKSKAVARILGFDVDTLFAKKQLIKIPDKLQKPENKAKVEDRELCEPSNSTLYMNVMVQTEEVKVIPLRRRDFYRDKGIQFTPTTNIIGTQTNSKYTGADLPLFRVIREMNENQLEALDDFIQFILEPAGNSGMDLYQQRKRLSEIYQTSQIPSSSISSSSSKRSAEEAGLQERLPSPPPPPSFERHHDFIKREPRSYPHSQTSERRRSNPPQSRSVHSQPAGRYNGFSDDAPSSSVKYFGRGGKRR